HYLEQIQRPRLSDVRKRSSCGCDGRWKSIDHCEVQRSRRVHHPSSSQRCKRRRRWRVSMLLDKPSRTSRSRPIERGKHKDTKAQRHKEGAGRNLRCAPSLCLCAFVSLCFLTYVTLQQRSECWIFNSILSLSAGGLSG